MRSVVLGSLAYDDSRRESHDHGYREPPPVGHVEQIEQAEGRDRYQYGAEVGSGGHRLQQLAHACAFPGAHGEDAYDREHHSDGGDQHGREYGLELHGFSVAYECGCPERDRGEDGAAVAFVEVGSHTRDVTYVVAHVVGYGRRVPGVVFRDSRLDLAHEVGSHVGGLGVDASADPGEQGLGGRSHAEGEHGRGDGDELLGPLYAYELVEDYVPERNVKESQADYGQAHHGSAPESYLQSVVEPSSGRVGGAPGGVGRRLHAHETGEAAEESAGEEREGHPGILDVESVCEHGEEHGKYQEYDDDYLILLLQIRHRAFADESGDLLHGGRAFVFLHHLAEENPGEQQGCQRCCRNKIEQNGIGRHKRLLFI